MKDELNPTANVVKLVQYFIRLLMRIRSFKERETKWGHSGQAIDIELINSMLAKKYSIIPMEIPCLSCLSTLMKVNVAGKYNIYMTNVMLISS